MNDEEIRKAACDAYEAEKHAGGSWLDGFEAVYRAGMEAGRAEAGKRAGRISDAENAGDMAAFLRRLESDPEEAARFLGDVDTRGLLKAKPKRRKAATVDAEPRSTVTVAEMMRHGVNPLAAEDWLRVRRQHKAPLTRSAWDATMREAETAGMTIGAVVQMCAERSWRGFRADYVAKNAPSGPGRGPRPAESFQSQAALARVQRIAPGAARKDVEPQKNVLQKWSEVIDDAGQPRLR